VVVTQSDQLVQTLIPLAVLYQVLVSVLHWEHPFISSTALVLTCVLLSNTYYLECVLIGCSLVLFGTGYLKCIADESVPSEPPLDPVCHINPVYYSLNPASESDQCPKKQVLEKYKLIIVQLQNYLIALNQLGDVLHRVYTWQDRAYTSKVVLSLTMVCLLPMYIPMNIVLVLGVLIMFCWNHHFYRVVGEAKVYLVSYILSRDDSESLASTTSLCDSEIEDMTGESLDQQLLKALGMCKGCCIDLTTTKRECCSNCGNSFCLNCCNRRVSKEMLGVTNPDTMYQEIAVCASCHLQLTNT